MKTFLQGLSDDEKSQVHERSLKGLANTGVRVDTGKFKGEYLGLMRN